MTADKILELWTNAVRYTGTNYSSPEMKAYEEFIINGKELPAELTARKWISVHNVFQSTLVKEMDNGENADIARRYVWLALKCSKYSLITGFEDFTEKNLDICRRAGYTFGEFFSEYNWESDSYRLRYGFNLEWCRAAWNVFCDEAVKYMTDELLFSVSQNKKLKEKLIFMLGILAYAASADRENHAKDAERILKYLDRVSSGFAVQLICRIYDISEQTMDKFRRYAENVHYYSSMEKIMNGYYGKNSFKDIIYGFGFQKNYYRACMLNYFSYSADALKKSLEELYSENSELFKDVCLEIINDKKENNIERVMYALSVLHCHDDGKREFEAVSEKLDHFIYRLYDKIKHDKSAEIKYADFMKCVNDDEVTADGFEIKLSMGYKIRVIGENIEFMSLLCDFFKPAEKCLKFFMIYSYNQKEYHTFGNFYTLFTESRERWLGISESESVKLLEKFLPSEAFFMTYCFSCSNIWGSEEVRISRDEVIRTASDNPDKAAAFFGEISDVQYTSAWLDLYYSLDINKDFKPLIDAVKGKSKVVRKKAVSIAFGYEDEIRSDLEKILPKLKGETNFVVSQLIRRWDNTRKFGADFEFTSNEFTEEFCKENINPASLKKIEWIDEMAYDGIRYADLSGTASRNVLKYILSEYLVLEEPCRLVNCDKAAQRLNQSDLQNALENIYKNWIEDGADTKKKFITLPYCLYASDSQILKMRKQLETWAAASRGQIAAFTVKNIALNGGKIALLTVDSISGKFPNSMVKNAAAEAIGFAAETLEVSVDELTDMIVPSLDFDKNGERIFDYGARTFTVSLMPDFSLSIHDNQKDKDIKSMPKPAADDDAVKAEAAKKEFSELKKQIKAVVTSQKQRLEKVFMNGRTWTTEKWRALFEENAVMHCFAETLIWGIYEDENLISTFRYLQDGSFCNEDDDEYELPENAQISLAHPAEMDEDLRSKWAEQLEDYEIIQPFAQLFADIITLTNDDVIESEGEVTKYNGNNAVTGRMTSVAKKYNMERGYTGDGGCFEGYWFSDEYTGIRMNVDADYLYFGQEYDEVVPISCVKFEKNNRPLNPLTIKTRFLSGCMAIIESMTSEE